MNELIAIVSCADNGPALSKRQKKDKATQKKLLSNWTIKLLRRSWCVFVHGSPQHSGRCSFASKKHCANILLVLLCLMCEFSNIFICANPLHVRKGGSADRRLKRSHCQLEPMPEVSPWWRPRTVSKSMNASSWFTFMRGLNCGLLNSVFSQANYLTQG